MLRIPEPARPARGTARVVGTTRAAVVAALMLAALPAAPAAAAWTTRTRTIATTGVEGDLGPQLGPGITFASLGGPQLNANGQFLFGGTLAGATTTDDQGLWLADAAGIRPLARVGTDGPLGPGEGDGVTFRRYNLGGAVLNNAGQVAFRGVIERSPDYQGLWLNGGGGDGGGDNVNRAIVYSDGPLGPNLGSGVEFIPSLSVGALNDAGEIFFAGHVNQSDPIAGGQAGVWQIGADGGVPQILARAGTTGPLGPGLGDDRTFALFSRLSSDAPGSVLADVRFEDAQAEDPYAPTYGILRLSATGHTPLWLSHTDGRYGPQLGEGVHFTHNWRRSAGSTSSDAGGIAVIASVEGTGVDDTNDSGIWRVSDEAIAPVARDGTDGPLGPGLGDDVVFDAYDSGPANSGTGFGAVSSHDGTVAFTAGLSGGTYGVAGEPGQTRGVFADSIDDGEGIEAIALTGTAGDLGPGLPGGEVFAHFASVSAAADGTLLFEAADRVGDGPLTSGLWAYASGDLRPLLRAGDVIDDRTVGGILSYDVDAVTRAALASVYFEEGGYSLLHLALSERLAGDANDDGIVSLADFLILRSHFGGPGTFDEGDFNEDGTVSLADFLILRSNFGTGGGDPAAVMDPWLSTVPEPASLAMLSVGGLALLRRRARC